MEMQTIDGSARARGERLVSVLRSDASADPELDPKLGRERLVSLYEAMLRTRCVGDRFASLAATGEIGLFPWARGSEAAVVGATLALRESDWVFPTLGDVGAAVARGMSLEALAARALGSAGDALKGRDVPGGLSARALRIASASAPAATHLAHAVGTAWAARRRGEDLACAAFFDAPEIDAADFHTGLNFAGVMRAPVVFVCRSREGEAGAAEHAVAYGVASARADGSDVLAVVRAVSDALDRALEGEGATVLDLVIGEPDEALDRARAHLVRLGAWTEENERAVREAADRDLTSAIERAREAGAPAAGSMFDDVFARPLPEHERQRSALARAHR